MATNFFDSIATTAQEREQVALFGEETVYGDYKPAEPAMASEGMKIFAAAKCTTQAAYIQLADRLKALNRAYYIENNSPASNEEFDALLLQLEMVEQLHPDWTLTDSPARHVGSDSVAGVRQVGHRTPMLSTQKAHDLEALSRWFNRQCGNELIVEWKYDGVSASLVYIDGRLTEASTRGTDGLRGNDILRHVQGMANVPAQVAVSGRLEVRGEVVCPFAAWRSMLDRKKTTRDTANGLLQQQQDPSLAARSGLVFKPFEVIADQSSQHSQRLEWLQQLGFEVEPYRTASTLYDLEEIIASAEAERPALAYPTDGLVIKQDWDADRFEMGCTQKYPQWSVAWKFSPETAETTIRQIETTTASSGRQTIILHFDEITLGGKTCKKVRACEAQNFGTGRWALAVGDRIRIKLSGDVSPQFDCLVSECEGDRVVAPQSAKPIEDSCEITDSASGKKRAAVWVGAAAVLAATIYLFGPVAPVLFGMLALGSISK